MARPSRRVLADERAIDVPETSLQNKPVFSERPDQAFVSDVKKFIRDGGLPYLHPAHSHTKPPKGADVRYLGEFDLREEAPCPCCSPYHPKYKRNGKIAWFPEEKVVRLIGPDCFATLNPAGHESALDQFKHDERVRRDLAYLAANHHVLRDALNCARHNALIGAALDALNEQLVARLQLVSIGLPLTLWRSIRDGRLKHYVSRSRLKKNPDGSTEVIERSSLETFASVSGMELIDPDRKRVHTRLINAEQSFLLLKDRLPDVSTLHALTHADRLQVAKLLRNGLRALESGTEQAQRELKFLKPETIATLRQWSMQDDPQARVYLDRCDSDLYVGRSEYQKTRIRLDDALLLAPKDVPRIIVPD